MIQQAVKAEHNLEKSEKQEQTTLKNLFKAENIHDVAVSNVHRAQQNLEVRPSLDLKLSVEHLRAVIEQALRQNEGNTKNQVYSRR